VIVELPWMPASLSGHANGHWRSKAPIVAKHREWARLAALASNPTPLRPEGDIHIGFTFYPPNRRGDRTNYPNRLKPYIDGIAEALGVNDRRFLPTYHFAEPVKGPGKVVVTIGDDCPREFSTGAPLADQTDRGA